VVKSYW